MKKATVTSVVYAKNFPESTSGEVINIFNVVLDNGDRGDFFSRSNPCAEITVGQTIEYEINEKTKGNYTNYILKLKKDEAAKGKFGKKGGSYSNGPSNKQVALQCAVAYKNAASDSRGIITVAKEFLTFLEE